jgi:probable rRNA maturation factor
LVILKKKVAGLSPASLERFTLRARKSVGLRGSITLLVTSSQEMRSLNSRFRGKNKPTDVLSFPAAAETGKQRFAGEIAISADIARQNAAKLGHSAALEIKVLALHGILHLAGYDHERDNGVMARKEAHLRKLLRLPSTLTERGELPVKDAHRIATSRSRGMRRTA